MPRAVVDIESIAAGGDGVGRVDGMAVFVPRTAPGDRALVTYRARGRFGRGMAVRLEQASPDRVDPACAHYERDECGGCQVQHLRYDAQLEAKRLMVRDAMRRIARRDADIPPVVPSPDPWHYRTRLTLTMRRQRDAWVMGMHSWRDVNQVFNLVECPITDGRVMSAWREVQAAGEFLPGAAELRGTIRLAGDSVSFLVEGGRAWPDFARFAEACPGLGAIAWRTADGTARTMVDRGAGSSASFGQVNRQVAVLARGEVIARALEWKPVVAVDAYSGVGETASLLAEAGVRVVAIESDPEATAVVSTRLPAPSRVITGRVEDVLSSVLPADVVVLNPPRAGVDARVTDVLDGSTGIHGIVYMSCDPATLARDLARLPSWRLRSVRAYDMFPQTAHVEVVCALDREAA